MNSAHFRSQLFGRSLSILILFAFISTAVCPPAGYAQLNVTAQASLGLSLPAQLSAQSALPVPSAVVSISNNIFQPALIKGLTLYPDNPFEFDFIVDPGDDGLKDEALKTESTKLMKYFLAALTVPETEMWVNLSPYEKDRVIPSGFGETEMGRDLLAQDYLLKQLTASLMNPEETLGAEFWQRVYAETKEKFGTTDIPMDAFNKVWIVPQKAVVYVHGKTVFVTESHLKVMMEGDYKSGQWSVIRKKKLQTNL